MSVTEILDTMPMIAFMILVLVIAVHAVIGSKCPNCARRKTMTLTGEKRRSQVRGSGPRRSGFAEHVEKADGRRRSGGGA